MKTPLSIVIAAALLTQGCKKQEESTPRRVGKPSQPDNTPAAPPPPAPAAPAEPIVRTDPPAPEEVDAFLSDLKKLAEEVELLPTEAAQAPSVDAVQKSYVALIERRNALAARMNEEQKVNMGKEVTPLAKRIGPRLVRLRLARAQEQRKAHQSNPNGPQADPSLEDLIPGLKGSSATPPPPAKRQTGPPQ